MSDADVIPTNPFFPMKTFLPFHQILEQEQVVVVDAMHAHGVLFSHWRGARRWEALHDDTSLGIVLNALKAGHPAVTYPWVTNNHFDVDGFLGVWSLFEPELALRYEVVLRQAALIGDFREFKPTEPGADAALKIVCWLNAIEKEHFYVPFGAKDEASACVPKYEYCLPRFAELLQEPDRFAAVWGPEYARVRLDQERITRAYLVEDIRLWVVEAPEPLHYYALFGQSQEADMVLSLYEGQRYELEYKYTSWVDTATRLSFPRLPLQPLADQLNAQEIPGQSWSGDGIMDTGPQLRLGKALPKHLRYAHPYEREWVSSGIPSATLKANLLAYFRHGFAGLQPRIHWTWQEMRQV